MVYAWQPKIKDLLKFGYLNFIFRATVISHIYIKIIFLYHYNFYMHNLQFQF